MKHARRPTAPDPVAFRSSMGRLIVTYRGSLMLANGPAVAYDHDRVDRGRGGHGKHGATSVAPGFGRDLPLSERIERELRHFVRVADAKLEAERATVDGDSDAPRKRTAARRAEDDAIRAAEGLDPTAIAYLYGRTTEGVRKLRRRHGLDADTGERLRQEPPVTAPARDALAAFAAVRA